MNKWWEQHSNNNKLYYILVDPKRVDNNNIRARTKILLSYANADANEALSHSEHLLCLNVYACVSLGKSIEYT